MPTTLVRRARELLGMGRQPGPVLARQLAREFPAHEHHEVWGAVGLGPNRAVPPPLYLEHLNPHEVRTRVDPRPDKPPEHPDDEAASAALKAAGARKPRRPHTPRQDRILAAFRAAGEAEIAEQEGIEAFVQRSR